MSFPIEFSYQDKTYHAIVSRISSGPVEYVVSDFDPKNQNWNDHFIYSVDESGEGLTWNTTNHKNYVPEVEGLIAKAILHKVQEMGFELGDRRYLGI